MEFSIPFTGSGYGSLIWEIIYLAMSVGIAYLIISPAVPVGNFGGVVSLIAITVIIYIMLSNMTGSNVFSALPKATYPIPPNLDHEGVGLDIIGGSTLG